MLGFLLSALSFADPVFIEIVEGEPAPFSGRLLNDEAIVKLAVHDKFKVEQCNLQIDYELKKQKIEQDLNFEKQKIKLESDIEILKTKDQIRDQAIQEMKDLRKPWPPVFYTSAGFIGGAGITIAILYAIN